MTDLLEVDVFLYDEKAKNDYINVFIKKNKKARFVYVGYYDPEIDDRGTANRIYEIQCNDGTIEWHEMGDIDDYPRIQCKEIPYTWEGDERGYRKDDNYDLIYKLQDVRYKLVETEKELALEKIEIKRYNGKNKALTQTKQKLEKENERLEKRNKLLEAKFNRAMGYIDGMLERNHPDSETSISVGSRNKTEPTHRGPAFKDINDEHAAYYNNHKSFY